MNKVDQYVILLQTAVQISEQLVSLIKGYAAKDLSPAEYAALEVAWSADIAESAKNAGL